MPEVLVDRAAASNDPVSSLRQLLDRATGDGWLSLEHQVRVALAGIEHSPSDAHFPEVVDFEGESGPADADADLR